MITVAPRLWLTLLLAVLVTPAAAASDPASLACGEGLAEGWEYDPVSVTCSPMLERIGESALADTLAADWRESLTFHEAEQLEYFDAYYADRTLPVASIDTTTLDEIVEALDNPSRIGDERSAWDRFVDWLKNVFGGDDGEAPRWLDDWLEGFKLPRSVFEWSFYILAFLIIIGAIVVIANEIRAARGGGRLPDSMRRTAIAGAAPGELTIADLDRAALADKPGILLRLIIDRLEARSLMARRPASTHRELAINAGTGLGSAQLSAFEQVTTSAERVRYGDAEPGADEVGTVVATGRALLDDLERS